MATCRTPRGGRAHDCLTSAEVGGLTLAMLHWMFTDWRLGRSESKSRPARPPGHPGSASQEQRAARELRRGLGVCDPPTMTRTASRTGRGNFRLLCAGAGASSRSRTRRCVQEWSDLSSACPEARFASSGVLCSFGVAPGEVPINIYGPGSDSGTYDFFAEATLCEDLLCGEPRPQIAGARSPGALEAVSLSGLGAPAQGGRLRPRGLPVLSHGQAQRPGAAQHGAGHRRLHPKPEASQNRCPRWTHVACRAVGVF